MLSTTNTIIDIKKKLKNDYSYYGYSTAKDFDSDLETAVDDAKYETLLPILQQGQYAVISNAIGYYDLIASKDKVDLTLSEGYIYRAEVYFACAQFMEDYARAENQSTLGDSESISVEGYSRSVSGSTTGKDVAVTEFMKKGRECLAQAGYKVGLQLQRGSSFLDRQGRINEAGFFE